VGQPNSAHQQKSKPLAKKDTRRECTLSPERIAPMRALQVRWRAPHKRSSSSKQQQAAYCTVKVLAISMYLGGAAARLRARDSRALSGAAGSSCPCDKDSARTPLACGLQAIPNACTSVQCWQGSDTLTASSITTCRPDPEQAGNNTHPVLDTKSWATTRPLSLGPEPAAHALHSPCCARAPA